MSNIDITICCLALFFLIMSIIVFTLAPNSECNNNSFKTIIFTYICSIILLSISVCLFYCAYIGGGKSPKLIIDFS